MAGEKSVKSGDDGHKIVHELLSLVGWHTADHIEYDCSYGEKHKSKETSKGPRKNHNIDMLFQYDSPLNHKNRDIVLISVKHNENEYPSGFGSLCDVYIKDLAQCIHCAPTSTDLDDLVQATNRNKHYVGIILWLSSSQHEKERDLVGALQDYIAKPRALNFNTIYIIDNRKATFLYSAIQSARSYRPTTKLKYLYHHTGQNQNIENILLTSTILPIELLNSSIIPIVKEDDTKASVLLYCNCAFNKDYLKRIIWLSHKLCGLSNEIIIYFTDYDETKHSAIVSATKHSFADIDFISKIVVKKFDYQSFISLKESNHENENIRYTSSTKVREKKVSNLIEDDRQIDKILPFGEMIKPILSSSQLTDADLKEFLESKGIIVKSTDKESTVPIFASMLLLPEELDKLRELLEEKEEKPKSTIRNAVVSEDKTIKDVMLSIPFKLEEITPDLNCKILDSPQFRPINENRVEVQIRMERVNTTKDLITGTTFHDASISLDQNGGNLLIKMEHSSNETKKYVMKVVDRLNQYFKRTHYSVNDAVSIKFGDFENKERIDFLLSFAEVKLSETFFNGNIENIKFKPDDKIENLPEDLEPMKDTVSNLNINGNNLDKLSYIKSNIYKPCVLLERVKIKFDFEHNGERGFCTAEIGFPSSLNNRSVDFESDLQTSIVIPNIKTNKKIKTKITILQKQLSRKLDEIVVQKYSKIKNK